MAGPAKLTARVRTLPHPKPPIDPAVEPLVGNESVDDNLAELAEMAMWKAIGVADRTVELCVETGVVRLSGTLKNAAQLEAVTAAVSRVPGVREVVAQVILDEPKGRATSSRRGAAPQEVAIEPLLYVVRYCGLDEASMSAAVREAVSELDRLFTGHGLKPAKVLYMVYRNRRPDTVTIEIGMPVEALPNFETSGLHAGHTPGGQILSGKTAAGVDAMLATVDRLTRSAVRHGLRPADHWWQRFETEAFRPWRGHPVAKVFLPANKSEG